MDMTKLITRQRFYWFGGATVVLLLVLSLGLRTGTADLPTYEVKRGPFVVDIQTSGELKALNSRVVTRPRIRWSRSQIVKLAPEGSMVEEGDFLIQFDTSESMSRVEEKRNELQNALAELEREKANMAAELARLESELKRQEYAYEQAKIRYEQMKYEAEIRRREQELELKKAELALQQARDKVEAQKVIREANLRKAELRVEQARLELKKAEEELASQTLTAPIGGLVVYKEVWGPSGRAKVKVGDTPWPGQALIEIPDLSVMQVQTKVNEVEVNRVAPGQQVVIKIDALPEETFYGKVDHVATLAKREKESEVKTFDVLVTIEGEDQRLRPGMTASCQIITDRLTDVLYVPLESVFEKDGQTICYVLASDPEPRPVKVGPKNSDYIVVEEGLQEGDKVTLWDPTRPLEEIGKEPPVMQEKKKPKKESDEGMIIIG